MTGNTLILNVDLCLFVSAICRWFLYQPGLLAHRNIFRCVVLEPEGNKISYDLALPLSELTLEIEHLVSGRINFMII